jgi:hypothetical protein
MSVALPPCSEALEQLQSLLVRCGVERSNVHWLDRPSVVAHSGFLRRKPTLFVPSGARSSDAAAAYAVAREAGHGIELHALGIDSNRVYCLAFVPPTELEAELRMIGGLKLSVLTPLLPVSLVSENRWHACARRQSPERTAWLDELFGTHNAGCRCGCSA